MAHDLEVAFLSRYHGRTDARKQTENSAFALVAPPTVAAIIGVPAAIAAPGRRHPLPAAFASAAQKSGFLGHSLVDRSFFEV